MLRIQIGNEMKSVKNFYRQLTQKITPQEMAEAELAEAERELMNAYSAVEYAQSVVAYNKRRITRLRRFLNLPAVTFYE